MMCDEITIDNYFKGDTFNYSEVEKQLLWERQQEINRFNSETNSFENIEDIEKSL